jgi:hypothetical protein
LTSNEQNGEIVNKIYDILQNFVAVSKSSSQAIANIGVLDMSKSLLQICIKHSSIYQCESAFIFLRGLVEVSDKYQNKQDIKYSLTKIMPASIKGAELPGGDADNGSANLEDEQSDADKGDSKP